MDAYTVAWSGRGSLPGAEDWPMQREGHYSNMAMYHASDEAGRPRELHKTCRDCARALAAWETRQHHARCLPCRQIRARRRAVSRAVAGASCRECGEDISRTDTNNGITKCLAHRKQYQRTTHGGTT